MIVSSRLVKLFWASYHIVFTLIKATALSQKSSSMSKPRVELFFKSVEQLKERVHFLNNKGYNAYNLVNKNNDDPLNEWINIIRDEVPQASVCVHYSLKYNKRGGPDVSYDRFLNFLQSIPANTDVLLVSGTGVKTKKFLDSVNTLKRLQLEHNPSIDSIPKIDVAFNPFFSLPSDQEAERYRLLEKIETTKVSKVYFQFGSNLDLLQSSLEWLSTLNVERNLNLEFCGSIFMPTAKLIAQQKFRPWNGVFLCESFLRSPESARKIILRMINLYHQYDVELLIEAPGVRNVKDLDIVSNLLNGANNAVILEKDDVFTNPSSLNSTNGINDLLVSPKRRRIVESEPQSITFGKPAIVLFGSFDVRLNDNQAFEQASHHACVIPIFLWNKAEQGKWGVCGALEVILKNALRNLNDDLKVGGLQLICRNTDNSNREIIELCKETGAATVYWNREHTTESRLIEKERKKCLITGGVCVVESQSSLLYDPEKVSLSKGFNRGHWGTLMPFLKSCKKQFGEPRRPTPLSDTFNMIKSMKGPDKWPKSTGIEGLFDMKTIAGLNKWDLPILNKFQMSEEIARKNLNSFFDKGFLRYETDRSRADLEGATSMLSTHLRIGTLSPHYLYYKTADSALSYDKKKTFSRRLFWRELAYFQLYCFPRMREECIRAHYENVEWVSGAEENRRFEAWKWGKTGYPMVDAGMRELYATGWMTQSVRMVVASFLVEYLRVNWVRGCEWFHYTLADADSAINAMMWQNAGRSGIDQWNFVLSPENASQDLSGDYTRRWVPELANLPTRFLHRPWQAKNEMLESASVFLGDTYPHRIVANLKLEREKSIENVIKMKRRSLDRNNSGGYDLIKLPSGEMSVVFTKKEFRINNCGEHVVNKLSGRKKQVKVTKFLNKKNQT